MWDTLYEALFNPSHEMPIGILIGIPIAAVLFNYFMPRYARRRSQQKKWDKAVGKKPKNKK